MPELNQRARKILQAVVHEFLQTGDAVGSRTVTRYGGIDLSPATVRNVMSDLAEAGLLTQPHTSAGRIPTTAGLRFFVNSLLKVRRLSDREKEEIRARYGLLSDDLDEAMEQASKVLSELAQQASIIITPVPERQRLKHIEFVPLREGELLAILVSAGDQLVNKLVRVDFPVDALFLQRVNNYLGELLTGKTLEDVRAKVAEELGKETNQMNELKSRALKLGLAALPSLGKTDVIVTGQAHLLDDASSDPVELEQMKALLLALDEKERIIKILDKAVEAQGIQVWLGAETPFAEMGDLSVVAKPYGPEEHAVGSIAVVGPTRMNYSRVISLVDFTADMISELLQEHRR